MRMPLFLAQQKIGASDEGGAVVAESHAVEFDEHSFSSPVDTVGMDTMLRDIRALEDRLKAASPQEAAKLAKELVKLKGKWLER